MLMSENKHFRITNVTVSISHELIAPTDKYSKVFTSNYFNCMIKHLNMYYKN